MKGGGMKRRREEGEEEGRKGDTGAASMSRRCMR